MPTRPHTLALLLPLLLTLGCAHSEKPIPFPNTPAGKTARAFYRNPHSLENFDALYDIETESDRAALTPALLAIINENKSPRSLQAALILSDWNPQLATTSPEFKKIIPLAAQSLLVADNWENPDSAWSSWSGVILLARMGPEAIDASRIQITRRFLAPVENPIEDESPEFNVRTELTLCLAYLGPDGIPSLLEGLKHPDPFVRRCSLLGLALPSVYKSSPATHRDPAPYIPQHTESAILAARKSLPQIASCLADPDQRVVTQACRTISSLAQPSDATPDLLNRLRELQSTSAKSEATEALQKLSPPQTRPAP